jgi:hypothetical protein
MTPALYWTLTDYELANVYFAGRDDDHRLIPLRRRQADRRDAAQTGSPDRAGRELPSREELGVPAEAFNLGVPQDYTLMFFQCWVRRGEKPDAILTRFREHVGRN